MTGHRTDANHAAIRDALRQAGAYVIDCTPWPGAGFDLIAVHAGIIYFGEVKAPGGKMTNGENVRSKALADYGANYHVWHTPEEALKAIGAV